MTVIKTTTTTTTNKKDKQPNFPTLHAHPLFKYKLVWIFSLKARRRSYIIDSNANLRTFHNQIFFTFTTYLLKTSSDVVIIKSKIIAVIL